MEIGNLCFRGLFAAAASDILKSESPAKVHVYLDGQFSAVATINQFGRLTCKFEEACRASKNLRTFVKLSCEHELKRARN